MIKLPRPSLEILISSAVMGWREGKERIFYSGDLKPTKRIAHSEKPKTSEFTLHIRIVHRDMLDRFYVM